MLFCKILHRRLCTSFPALMRVFICPIHWISLQPNLKESKSDGLPASCLQHQCRHHSRTALCQALLYRGLDGLCAKGFDNQSAHIQNGRCGTLMAACMLPRKRC